MTITAKFMVSCNSSECAPLPRPDTSFSCIYTAKIDSIIVYSKEKSLYFLHYLAGDYTYHKATGYRLDVTEGRLELTV